MPRVKNQSFRNVDVRLVIRICPKAENRSENEKKSISILCRNIEQKCPDDAFVWP